jgi:hypothetical protein
MGESNSDLIESQHRPVERGVRPLSFVAPRRECDHHRAIVGSYALGEQMKAGVMLAFRLSFHSHRGVSTPVTSGDHRENEETN